MNYTIKTIITFLLLLTFGFTYGSDLDFKGTIEFTSQKDSQYTFELKDNSEISLIQNGESIYTYELEYVEKTEDQGYPVYMYYVTNDKEGYQELMIFDLQDLTVNERREKLDQTGPVGLAFIIDLDESDYNYINVEVTKGKLSPSYFNSDSSQDNSSGDSFSEMLKKDKYSKWSTYTFLKDDTYALTQRDGKYLTLTENDKEVYTYSVTYKSEEELEGGFSALVYDVKEDDYQEVKKLDYLDLSATEKEKLGIDKEATHAFMFIINEEEDDYLYIPVRVTASTNQSMMNKVNGGQSIITPTIKKNKSKSEVVFSSKDDDSQTFTIKNNETLIWVSDGNEQTVDLKYNGKESLEGVTMYSYTTLKNINFELSIFDLRKLTKDERNAVLSTDSPIVIFFSNPDNEDDDIVIEANYKSGEFSE